MKMLLYPVNSIHDVRVGRSGVPLDLCGTQLLDMGRDWTPMRR